MQNNPVNLVDPYGLDPKLVPTLFYTPNFRRIYMSGGGGGGGGGRGCPRVPRGGGGKAPDFVVSPKGTAYPVPKGAQGPKPVINPQGRQTGTAFTGGNGGANSQVDTIRIMNPTPARGKNPGYPKGYIKYQNKSGQGVDPYTGRTIPNTQSHHTID